MAKENLLASEIIAKYHPRYRRNQTLKKNLVKHPKDYNLAFLVEEAMAAVGGYKFVNGDHYDLSDYSEVKTASIRVKPAYASGNSYTGEITGVTTANGTAKLGPIRLVIYNPHTDELMYYMLPKDVWSNHIVRHPTSGVGKVMYSYNKITDEIKRFAGHRVKSFRQLALSKA